MKIIKQINEQECGICCLTMLYNYYYDNKISKQTILNKYYFKNNEGLSILDLEELSNKYNIFLESFESNWEEIFSLKPKNPFILLIKNNYGLHYVVATYKQNKIFIYDPTKNKKDIYTKDKKLETFANVFISSEIIKNKNKINNYNELKNKYKFFNWDYFLIVLSTSLFLLLINLLDSFLFSKIFSNLNNVNKILIICLLIIISLVIKLSISFLINNYKQKYINKLFKHNLIIINKYLSNKHYSFFQTTKKAYILNYYSCLKSYISFYLEYYVNICINIIVLFVSIILIIFINIYLLIIFFLLFVINLIWKRIIKNNTLEYQENNINKFDDINNSLIKFVDFNKNNFNLSLNKTLLNNIKNNINKITNIEYNTFKKQNFSNYIFETILQVLNVLVYIIFALFIKLELSKLIFSLSIFSYSLGSMNKLIDLYNDKKVNNINLEIINTISFNNNLSNSKLDIVNNTISINNKKYKDNLLIKSCIKPCDLKTIDNYLFNNKNNYYKNLIYLELNNNIFLDLDSIMNKLNIEQKSLLINFLESINYSSEDKINFRTKIVFVLFSILNNKDKIIIINNDYEINNQMFEYSIIYKLLNEINKNNFLMFLNNNLISHYPTNYLELEE